MCKTIALPIKLISLIFSGFELELHFYQKCALPIKLKNLKVSDYYDLNITISLPKRDA